MCGKELQSAECCRLVEQSAARVCIACAESHLLQSAAGPFIARVVNDRCDPLDFRDEIKAVVNGVNIFGMENTERVRQVALRSVDELFALMKRPSSDWPKGIVRRCSSSLSI